MFVLHDCDHKWCINPTHLHLGDHTANMHEAVVRGRMKKTAETRARMSEAQYLTWSWRSGAYWRKMRRWRRMKDWPSPAQLVALAKGRHVMHHVNKGVIKPDCEWCVAQ